MSADQHTIRVRDLIEVPAVQTVVHLQDLASPEQRSQLAESFVLTDEVRNHLKRLLAVVQAPHGTGTFLRGHYGAGKSHFLVFLQLLLRGDIPRDNLASLEPELAPILEALGDKRFLVVSTSLISHASTESLEAIVTRALEEAGGPAPLPFPDAEGIQAHIDTLRYHLRKHHPDTLEQFLNEHDLTERRLFEHSQLGLLDQLAREVRFPFRPDPGRAVRFQQLFDGLGSSPFSGLVLLMDELSEFLHARTGPGLTEDVRFLQFMGEAAREYPLYIVAALQEYLEAAEYGLPGELVRKIKDRYPNNMELTTTHIEELIGRRLIRHRAGADAQIELLYREMRSYLQGFPVPASRFIRAYPVHPATILLLDRLKPLLSRSRGIVDFVHFRLKGSPERGIPGMLDAPADTLLTPDAIFDHFQLRIRENLETAAFDTTVYDYYRRALPQLLEDAEQAQLALRLVKVLILLAISPEPRPYSIRTLTHALLVRVSRFDPDANFQVVQDILETLVARGAFVERQASLPDGRPSFDDVYRLSLRADLNLVATRRVQAAQKSLQDAPDLRIFEALAPGLQLDSLPLGRLLGSRAQSWSIQWQRTQREGRVILGNLLSFDVPKLLETLDELDSTELDWVLLMGVPYDVQAQRQHLDEVLLPALRRIDRPGAERPAARTLLFWLPEALSFSGREGEFLRETLARRAVLNREREEAASSQTKGLIELLEKLLEGDKARIEGLFHQTWYLGQLLSSTGPGENLSNLGRPPFAQTLLAILTPVLGHRYPEHAACAPLGRLPTLDDVEAVVERLYRVGMYTARGGEGDPIGTRLVSLLRPLRLVKKSGSTLTLSLETDKPGPARTLLEQLSTEPSPLKPLSLFMRKGPFGMSPPMFQLLVLGLTYGGAIVCFSGERRREPGQLSGLNFDQITAVARSESVALDVSPLAQLPFLPENVLPRGELNFARQEQLWSQLREARDGLGALIERTQAGLSSVRKLKATEHLALDGLEQDLRLLLPLTQVGGAGVSPHEGITQFVAEVRQQPQLPWLYARVKAASQFFQVGLERFFFISGYVERLPALPSGLLFAALRDELSEVRARLKASDLLYSTTPMELLEAAFRRFQEKYAEAYAEAHAQAKGPARYAPLQALRQTVQWQVLTRLAALKNLTLDDHVGPLTRRMSLLEAGACDRLRVEELRTNPQCRCGFALSDPGSSTAPPTGLPLDELATAAHESLVGILSGLLEAESQKAIARLQGALQATGRLQEAARLAELLRPAPSPGLALALETQHTRGADAFLQGRDTSTTGTPNLNDALWTALLTSLSQSTIALIDQALAGVTLIDERSLEMLREQLRDRCLPRAELEQIFQRWLGAGSNYIRVVDSTS